MQFLAVKQKTTANIFGHTYHLTPCHSPQATLNDILVSDDSSAYELLVRHKDILTSVTFGKDNGIPLPKPLEETNKIEENSKILILRSGGIGDHIMFTPAIEALKEKLPGESSKIRLAVQKDMFPIFQGLPYIEKLYPLPMPLADVIEADYVIDFSETLGINIGSDVHFTDYYLDRMGIKLESTNGRVGEVSADLHRSKEIISLFDRLRNAHPDHLFILLNWYASTFIKSLPPNLFSKVTRELGKVFFLVAHPSPLHQATDEALTKYGLKILNISYLMNSLYDFFTSIHLSDAVICADTSVYHIASVYQKPSVVIMGPTYPVLTRYYPLCDYIDASYSGKHCTAPCGRIKGPCPEVSELGTPHAPCLMSIAQDTVTNRCRRMIREKIIRLDA